MAVKYKTVEQGYHVLERSSKTKDYCACTNECTITCIHTFTSRYLKFSEYCPNTSFACNVCHNFKLKRKQGRKRGLPMVHMPTRTSPGRCTDNTRNWEQTTLRQNYYQLLLLILFLPCHQQYVQYYTCQYPLNFLVQLLMNVNHF